MLFWISGFFFPPALMTAGQQNEARKHQIPIDILSYGYTIMQEVPEDITAPPEAGIYIDGIFLEAARWDKRTRQMCDPKPKEIFSPMAIIRCDPVRHRVQPEEGIYRCPIYKILTRVGVLSTTGHSTNFVFWLEIPTPKQDCKRPALVSETNAQVLYTDQKYWIKAGVAGMLSLRY